MASSPQQQGTGFVNLNNYLQANQPNQLANTIGGDITQAGQQANTDINSSLNQFQNDAASQNLASTANQQAAQNALTAISNGNIATNSSGAVALDPSEVSQFQTFLAGQYGGPTSLSNATQLQSEAQNATNLGNDVNTAQGRSALLQQYVGGPQYTQGEQTLDSALLGQNAAPLQQAQQSAAGANQAFGRASQTAQNIGQSMVGAAQQFGQNLNTQLQNQATGIGTQLQNTATADQTAVAAAQNQFLSALNNPSQLTAAQMNTLGLKPGDSIYNVNLASPSFYTPEAAANISNVATQNQQNQIAALGQLANQAPGQLVAGYTPGATTYNAAQPYTYNSQALQNAIQNQASNYQTILGGTPETGTFNVAPNETETLNTNLPAAIQNLQAQVTNGTNPLSSVFGGNSPAQQQALQAELNTLNAQQQSIQNAVGYGNVVGLAPGQSLQPYGAVLGPAMQKLVGQA
jgi:hypothetical protein